MGLHDIDSQFGSMRSRTTWQEDAACRDIDPEIFFDRGGESTHAVQICRLCPVRDECVREELEYVTAAGDIIGVRGALTQSKRKKLFRMGQLKEYADIESDAIGARKERSRRARSEVPTIARAEVTKVEKEYLVGKKMMSDDFVLGEGGKSVG